MAHPQADKYPASHPGVPTNDYLIVGGGVAGCALTYALSVRGARVTLLERGRVGGAGASSVPVALLNPYRGRSARANDLDLAGLAAMRRLVSELETQNLDHGVHQSGVLRIASNTKQAKTWRKREGVRWFEPEEVTAVYHAPFGGFLVERGGWLEPHKFLRALLTATRGNGANVLEGCHVQEVGEYTSSQHYKEVKALWRGSSHLFRAKTLIFCMGAHPMFGSDLEVEGLEYVAGEVIGLKTDAQLPHALAGAIYGAQTKGHVLLGGNHRPAERTDESAPAQLQRAGSWFIPALKEAELASVWTGVRAKTADNMPVVKEVRKNVWFFGALAGRGFLCAAYLAEGLAEELAGVTST